MFPLLTSLFDHWNVSFLLPLSLITWPFPSTYTLLWLVNRFPLHIYFFDSSTVSSFSLFLWPFYFTTFVTMCSQSLMMAQFFLLFFLSLMTSDPHLTVLFLDLTPGTFPIFRIIFASLMPLERFREDNTGFPSFPTKGLLKTPMKYSTKYIWNSTTSLVPIPDMLSEPIL